MQCLMCVGGGLGEELVSLHTVGGGLGEELVSPHTASILECLQRTIHDNLAQDKQAASLQLTFSLLSKSVVT